mmetsp:Transcript_8455/g.17448  ORF Transcript_8455/g.17448 Transcript_8455/m.17448 type:complete len:122 (-) Transcript_8455:26-391(-)
MTLIKWHGVPKLVDRKVEDEERRAKWIAILQSGKAASSIKEWTTEEEAALIKAEDEPMLMKETVLGCLKMQQKQELMVTFRAMSAEEKATFWAEIDGGNGGEVEEGKVDEGECKNGQEGSV